VSHLNIKKKKNVILILALFSTHPSTQTIKITGFIFFSKLALKNWAMNVHFNPISRGGAER